MERRAFIGTLTGGLLAAPLAAEAQPAGKVFTVGLVSIGTDPAESGPWQPFLDAMRERGYVEGRNLVVKRAFANGQRERLAGLVAELVGTRVDVIVTTGSRETRAVQQAAATIPIVMNLGVDPVAEGFVKSLARPGGNVTGVTSLVPGLSQKYVGLLKEILPTDRGAIRRHHESA